MVRPLLLRRAPGVLAVLLTFLALSLTFGPVEAPAQYAGVLVPGRGDVFCPSTALVLGSAIVPAGRCFKMAAFRDVNGSYLAFLPPDAPIAPGQTVTFNSASPGPLAPFLLVPVSASAALAPNTMALVPGRFETRGAQTRIVLMGGAFANTIVTVAQPAVPVVQAPETPAAVVTPTPSPSTVIVASEGQVFCPSATLVYGSVAIPQGDCYRVALLRNAGGTFVAFVPQAIALPAGATVALSAAAMGAVASRAYLVPISTSAILPMNTLVMVPARIGVVNGQEVVVLTGGPAANTVIRLDRR